ncbi:MAG: lysophospholipase [Pseudomonadota bacterium]|nr:lysophospholipase [Pseudomonadota bacterium]
MTMLKTIAGLLLLFALLYLALSGWMFFKQRDLIYFPQFTRVGIPPADLELPVNGAVLRGWVANPGRRDAIVYFGGNAETIHPLREEMAQWFPDRSVYLLPYRGYERSGGEPSEQALLADALVLYDHVRSRHPGASIAVIGRSLGSGVASYLAAHRPVSALVLVTPFDSMARLAQSHYRFLPVRWLIRERFESAEHLRQFRGPVLIVRASDDTIVPAARTQALVDALAAQPEVVEIAGSDHNNLSAVPEYRWAIVAFIASATDRGRAGPAASQDPAQKRS